MIGSINLAQAKAESDGQLTLETEPIEPVAEPRRQQDLLGQVYEYFLGQFALAEGKKGAILHARERGESIGGNAGALQGKSI